MIKVHWINWKHQLEKSKNIIDEKVRTIETLKKKLRQLEYDKEGLRHELSLLTNTTKPSR